MGLMRINQMASDLSEPQEGERHVTHPNCALYEIQSVDQETSNGAVNGVSYRVVPYISLHINTLSVYRQ